jgi:multidrug transporter EmrE-like cation transporter
MQFLALAIVFNIGANVLFKVSALQQGSFARIALLLVGLGLGTLNAISYTKSLASIKLSIAYPLFSSTCILVMTVLGALAFGDAFSLRQALGMAVLLAGILLISL